MGVLLRLTFCFIIQVLSGALLVDGTCDISTCSVVIYRDCAASPACGSRNGFSCAYIPQGISTSACAWNACPPVVGNGNWQSVCGGIDAVDIKGPCNAQLAQLANGGLPYVKVFRPGFHGVWATHENGVHFGDRVLSVKMSCADTNECASSSSNNCSSNAICTNTVGSYTCACKGNYTGDGFTCTDIDECKLGTHSCSASASCTNTIGGYSCQCNLGHFGDGITCGDGAHTVICDTNWMLVYLDPRLQMLNSTEITLRHKNCTAQRYLPAKQYGLITGFNDCGTTKRETATHIIYENDVFWTFGSSNMISRHSGRRISYSCSFPRNVNTNNAIFTATKSYIKTSEGGYGNFSVSLAMFNGSDFANQVASFPQVVQLNSRIYFLAKVTTNDSDITVLVEECTATPTLNINHPTSHTLIKDRCSVDASAQFHPTSDLHHMRFSFDSFSFVGNLDQVFLHCQIFLCHKGSTDSRCSSGCRGNNVMRVRRSLFQSSEANQSRRIQKRSTDEESFPPSKTYVVNLGPLQSNTNSNAGSKENVGSSGASGNFTATHGLILGVGLLSLCVVALAGKTIINKRLGRSKTCSTQKDGSIQNDGSIVNKGFALDANA